MGSVKTLVLRKETILALTQFTLLIGIATFAPLLLKHQQAITGPIVNATLYISVVLLGAQNALLVGLTPSIVALSVGLLPPILAPMVPFIMMGNSILILTFNYLRRGNFWAGVVSASIIKFLFLHYSSTIVIKLLLKKEVAAKVALMMSWPQLLTALTGGFLAFLFLKSVKKI